MNGPPGIGKSTLAQRYVDDHPLALNLDIDAIRTSMGQWSDFRESMILARTLGAAMARLHLTAGHDVVIPQVVMRVDFVDALEQLAHGAGAQFLECLVIDAKEEALVRFRERRAELDASGVLHPQQDIDASDDAVLSGIYDALIGVAELRPDTRVIRTTAGRVDEAYDALRAALT